MTRWKKPTKAEISAARLLISERARAGDLRLPGALLDMRMAIGMSQEQFAKIVGMTRRQVAEMETGNSNPTRDTLERVGRLFGFTLGFVPKAPQER